MSELADKVKELETRLTALEEHITARGPKVVKQDLETPGTARWEEPYQPPKTT
jgi:hypothetical protein